MARESMYDTRDDEEGPLEEKLETLYLHEWKESAWVKWTIEFLRCEWFSWPLSLYASTKRRPWGYREGYGIRWGWWIVRWHGGLRKWTA